jgi:hypothetical protein
MQKPLDELTSLPSDEVLRLVRQQPLLITVNDEPQIVAQSVPAFEEMVRRLRHLEALLGRRRQPFRSAGKVIPFRP